MWRINWKGSEAGLRHLPHTSHSLLFFFSSSGRSQNRMLAVSNVTRALLPACHSSWYGRATGSNGSCDEACCRLRELVTSTTATITVKHNFKSHVVDVGWTICGTNDTASGTPTGPFIRYLQCAVSRLQVPSCDR